MTQFPIQIPAGVVDTPTKKAKSSNWRRSHLIRWVNDRLTPVGGWERVDYTAFASKVREMHTWVTNTGQRMQAFLCERHCYVDTGDGLLVDVTPTGGMTAPTPLVAGGYGDNLYNLNEYGTPRPDQAEDKPVTPGYYIDNWGQNLLFMTSSDGRLLQWDPTTPATKASAVTNAPTGNRCFVVTAQRHVIVFKEGEFLWCDQENITVWTVAVNNTAGFLPFEPRSSVVTAITNGSEVLFWGASGRMYAIRYIGVPYVFAFDEIADSCTPVSPNAAYDSPVGAVWMSFNGIWRYEAGSVTPVVCPMWSYVTKRIVETHSRFNAHVAAVDTFSELWFFFVSGEAERPNECIIWNYRDGWWSQAQIARTCGSSSTYSTFPLMSDGDNIFKHESGWFYPVDEDETLPWATTFNLNMDSGAILSTLHNIMPDIEGDISGVAFDVNYNIMRSGNGGYTNVDTGEVFMMNNGYVPYRITGRDFRLTVKQTAQNLGSWSIGESLVDATPRGKL